MSMHYHFCTVLGHKCKDKQIKASSPELEKEGKAALFKGGTQWSVHVSLHGSPVQKPGN